MGYGVKVRKKVIASQNLECGTGHRLCKPQLQRRLGSGFASRSFSEGLVQVEMSVCLFPGIRIFSLLKIAAAIKEFVYLDFT